MRHGATALPSSAAASRPGVAGVRLAAGSVDFDHLGLDGFLALVAAAGLASVELYPASVGQRDEGQLAAALERHGIGVCCVNATPRFALGGERDRLGACRRETLRCIGWAQRLGAPYVNTYIGPYSGLDPSSALRGYLEDAQPVLEAAAAAGVVVLVENLADPRGEDPRGMGLARRPESLLELAAAVGPGAPWGLTFDAANFRQAGTEAYPYAYRLLRAHIRHVHARDSTRFSAALHGEPGERRLLRDSLTGAYLGVAVGAGSVNFDGLLAALAGDGYSGHLVIEPHVCPREAEDVLVESRNYILGRLASPV